MSRTDSSKPHVAHKTSVLAETFFRSFERHLLAERKDPDTIAHYIGASRQFHEYCAAGNLPDLVNARREHIEMWLVGLHQRLKPYSVRNRFNGLRQFYKWMYNEGEVGRDPMERMKPPSIEEVEKDIATPEEITRVFSFLEREKRWRDCVVVAVLYDTGLRATELADCLAEDVDLDAGYIRIRTAKNDEGKKPAISPTTIRYIDRYWRRVVRGDPRWLLNGRAGRKMTRSGIYEVMRYAASEAGIKGKILGAHDMRHTSATQIALSGEMTDSQMMSHFGWTDIKMVRRYTKAAHQQAAQQAHRKASPMERLPKPPMGRPKKQ